MYLTYEEYLEYGGALDEPTFNRLSFRCAKIIDGMTADRVRKMKVVPEAVKRCMLDLIEQESIYDKNVGSYATFESTGKMISSFSTDGYQETYGGGGESVGRYLRNLRDEIDSLEKKTISDYLAYERDDFNVKLLYRGVYN